MPSPPAPLSPAAIALNRFGLGARAGDEVPGDPQRWLIAQLDRFDVRPAGLAALPPAAPLVIDYEVQKRALRKAGRGAPAPAPATNDVAAAAQATAPDRAEDPRRALRRDFTRAARDIYDRAVQARVQSALVTEAPFVERLVHFWSNHFCVSADNATSSALAGGFERDAIRPHVLGRFGDMVDAVEHHPAMLIYLNQIGSVGPNSPAALGASPDPARRPGLNENLGREIMELHTLGARSGYGQGDVTEFARAMTGWTVDGLDTVARRRDPGHPGSGAFTFRADLHEPGTRTVLGRPYDQPGEAQARAVLADFATAPATATHVATKLARHFAGDSPPAPLVARLADAFTRSHGDLPTVYRTLIAAPECWLPAPIKFKTPWEWTVSSLRGLGIDAGQVKVAAIQGVMSQPVWRPGSPAGYDDLAARWAAPDALLHRVEVAQQIVQPIGDRIDARSLAPRLLPASLSPATAEQVARAESPGAALALLLVSPDFMRR